LSFHLRRALLIPAGNWQAGPQPQTRIFRNISRISLYDDFAARVKRGAGFGHAGKLPVLFDTMHKIGLFFLPGGQGHGTVP
jgi:hypothetical protein